MEKKNNQFEKKKYNFTNYIPFIISLIALFVSFRSCDIAKKSHNLSIQQYQDKFMTVLKCNYLIDQKVFEISPTNEKITFQKAKAFYPDSVSTAEWLIDPPEYYLHITAPLYSIQEIINKHIPKEQGSWKVLQEASIPIIIESYYTLDGYNMFDKSLYTLEFISIVNDDKFRLPSIKVKGLIFSEKIDVNTNTKDFLNIIWENGLKDQSWEEK